MRKERAVENPVHAITRRRFVALGASGTAALLGGGVAAAVDPRKAPASASLSINIPWGGAGGALSRTEAPCGVQMAAGERLLRAASTEDLFLEFEPEHRGQARMRVPAQLSRLASSEAMNLTWLMPRNAAGKGRLRLLTTPSDTEPVMRAGQTGGQLELTEAGRPILRYNYATIDHPELLSQVAEGSRKYAVARSDYIHPLYGFNGEELTRDWPVDHPHQRGIYWAWPEVDWRGDRGDLHALQKVFARPTGKWACASGSVFAQVQAENLWHWEGGPAIVRELAVIRAYRSTADCRVVDLEFTFEAIDDPVLIARRETTLYGGLNIRLNAVAGQQIIKHTAPAGAGLRSAWGDISGTFAGAASAGGLLTIQCARNPDFPGDWVDYPQLNWLQPTFPRGGARHELRKGAPLVLRYRLILHRGSPLPETAADEFWQAAHEPLSPLNNNLNSETLEK